MNPMATLFRRRKQRRPTSLRVLLTNNTLDARQGSELVIRDLALGLLKRGHTPIAYSTHLGEVAAVLRTATVPVIDQLATLSTPPDIIHGQHHLDAMTALLHFSSTPAIYYCHGWLPWQEAPPLFPRIHRYLAVDETCRDRLVCEHPIPPDRVEVLLNGVDLARFTRRAPLPEKPQRALVFSNLSQHVAVVQAACQRCELPLDVVGMKSGTNVSAPEEILGKYDLVFAKGRSALEAMAAGTAVILCDAVGAGEMVAMENWQRLRPLNFGIRALQHPVECDYLVEQIRRYNANDAAGVSNRVRSIADMADVIDELLRIYYQVIAEHQQRGAIDRVAESRATSAYLRGLAVRVKTADGLPPMPNCLASIEKRVA